VEIINVDGYIYNNVEIDKCPVLQVILGFTQTRLTKTVNWANRKLPSGANTAISGGGDVADDSIGFVLSAKDQQVLREQNRKYSSASGKKCESRQNCEEIAFENFKFLPSFKSKSLLAKSIII
jgi:hypothetical protein